MAGTKLGPLGSKAAKDAFGSTASRTAVTGLLAPACITAKPEMNCAPGGANHFLSSSVTFSGVECLIVRPCGMVGGGGAPLFAGKVVFFVPGSGGSAQDYARVPSAYFVTQGAAFVALNPRGWGGSQATSKNDIGDAGIIRDVLAARNYVIRNFFGNKNARNDVVMVGYSLGGHAAAEVSSDCAGLVLLSPIDSVQAVISRGTSPRLAPLMSSVGGAALGSSFATKTTLTRICAAAPKPKVLVLTGSTAAGDHLAASATGIVSVPNCITVSETPNPAGSHASLVTIMGTTNQLAALAAFAAALPPSAAYPTASQACAVGPLPAVAPPGGGGGGGGALPVVAPPGGGVAAVLPDVLPPSSSSRSSSSSTPRRHGSSSALSSSSSRGSR